MCLIVIWRGSTNYPSPNRSQLPSQYLPTPPSVQPFAWPPLPPCSPPQLAPWPLSSSSPQPSSSALSPPPGCLARSSWACPPCGRSSASAAGSQVRCCWWSLTGWKDRVRVLNAEHTSQLMKPSHTQDVVLLQGLPRYRGLMSSSSK